MIGIDNFMVYLITAAIFAITPGLDTMFVLNKSIGEGKRSGVFASLGINSGVFVHTLVGAMGLSVLLAKSPLGFHIIKFAGALYILYLGISGLRLKKSSLTQISQPELNKKQGKSFWSGFINNVFNPNVALFFIALFPQFISAEYLGNPMPFVILGTTYAFLGLVWFTILAFFAGTLSVQLHKHPKWSMYVQKGSGIIFILMAVIMIAV